MSTYYDEPTSTPTDPLSNPRVVTAIIIGVLAFLGIIGCVALFLFAGAGSTGQPTQAVIVFTPLPSPTATLTPVPSDTPSPSPTVEEGLGGGGEPPTATPVVRSIILRDPRGLVQYKNATVGDWTKVTGDTDIPEETFILTSENSGGKLEMSEGGIARVSSQTQFEVTQLDGTTASPETTVTLDFGKVWSVIPPLGTGSYQVATPLGNASVLDHAFMSVEYNSNEEMLIITCLDGKCRYSGEAGIQDLTTGQQLVIRKGEPLDSPDPIDQGQLNDWSLTKVPEVITLTPTATSTGTITLTHTPSLTRTPSNTRPPTNTPDHNATSYAASTNAAATANAASTNTAAVATNMAQQAADNLTATVYFLNITATANAAAAGAQYTATSNAATAAAVVQTQAAANATSTAAVFEATQTAAAIAPTLTAAAQPRFSFLTATMSVGETAGTIQITINLSPSSSSVTSVYISALPGSATSPSDYTFTNQTVNFAAFESQKSVPLTIMSDSFNEGNETLTLQLSSPSGGGSALGSPSDMVVTITNASLPEFNFSQASYSFAEPSNGTINQLVIVNLSSAIGSASSVRVNHTAGTATAGVCNPDDYSVTPPSGAPLAPGSFETLNFAAGETTKNITICIDADTLSESDESFQLFLSDPSPAGTVAVGATNTAAITITNTAVPLVEFDSLTFSGPESAQRIQGVIRVSPTINTPITVDYDVSFAGHTANAADFNGADPTTLALTAIIPANASTLTFDIVGSTAIKDDGVTEGNETFGINFPSAACATRGDGGPVSCSTTSTGSATVTIIDSVPPAITINDGSAAEGNGNNNVNMTVTLDRAFPAGGPSVTVDYAVTGGNAVQGACGGNTLISGINYENDFTLAAGTLTFAPTDTSENIVIGICGDSQSGANDTINITLSNPTNATIADGAGVWTINNDDGTPTITISPAVPVITEGALPSDVVARTFAANLSPAAEQDVTVNYSTLDGTAIAGQDYNGVTGQTVTIAVGNSSANFTINSIGDFLDEDNETLTVQLFGSTGGSVLGSPNSATLTIQDEAGDGPPDLTLNLPVSVNEDVGTVNVNVHLDMPSGKTVSVNYAIAPGAAPAATASVDYTASANGTLTFLPGEQDKTISITIINDATDETAERLNITLSGAVNATVAGGASSSKDLWINDNDP